MGRNRQTAQPEPCISRIRCRNSVEERTYKLSNSPTTYLCHPFYGWNSEVPDEESI